MNKRSYFRLVATAMLTACMALATVGCKTMVTAPDGTVSTVIDTNSVNKLAQVIRTATQGAAIIAVSKDPKCLPYLRVTIGVIDTLIMVNGGAVTPDELSKAFASIPGRGLQSPEAQLAVATGEGLYGAFYQQLVAQKIGGNYAALTLLGAVRDGLSYGVPPPATVPAVPTSMKAPEGWRTPRRFANFNEPMREDEPWRADVLPIGGGAATRVAQIESGRQGPSLWERR